MRRVELVLDANVHGLGLGAVRMTGLGQVVALFGPNGAGKSRLLHGLQRTLSNEARIIRDGADHLERALQGAIDARRSKLDEIHQELPPEPPNDDAPTAKQLSDRILQAQKDLCKSERDLDTHRRYAKGLVTAYGEYPAAPVTPISLEATRLDGLKEVGHYEMRTLHESLAGVARLDSLEKTMGSVTPFLHSLACAAFNAKHPDINPDSRELHVRLFYEAKRIIQELTSMEFGYVYSGIDVLPSLNERPVRMAELSHGQRVLLAYTVCLLNGFLGEHRHASGATLEGGLVVLDEPEAHLHPAALVAFVESMRKLVGDAGQLWLATHAMCLLPHLEPSAVWVVERGEVKSPGVERAHDALEALVGTDESVLRMRSFLEEPFRWAANHFAAQCLLPPEQAGFTEDDPQLFQIASVVKDRLLNDKTVRILDYGAGKGRLATMLQQEFSKEHHGNIEYVAVEPNSSLYEGIKTAAGSLLVDGIVWPDIGSIPGRFDRSVQVAVLCNVLHEVRPTKWHAELLEVFRRVSPDGSLVVCEDQAMPTGEAPHEIGFLVLGEQELRTLFTLDASPRFRFPVEPRLRDRILCAEIERSKAKISSESVANSVRDLERRLNGAIKMMREDLDHPDARSGRLYSFWCQMLVNCQFALQELQ